MNGILEGIWKEVVLTYFEVLFQHLDRMTERLSQDIQSLGQVFEHGAFKIRSRNANHMTAIFGKIMFIVHL